MAYKKDTADIYEIKMSRKKGLAMKIILSLMYVLSAFITFGAIYYVLNYFDFPITSIIIDIIFIAVILFAGTAVAKSAQELTMEEEKEGFLSFLSTYFFCQCKALADGFPVLLATAVFFASKANSLNSHSTSEFCFYIIFLFR